MIIFIVKVTSKAAVPLAMETLYLLSEEILYGGCCGRYFKPIPWCFIQYQLFICVQKFKIILLLFTTLTKHKNLLHQIISNS